MTCVSVTSLTLCVSQMHADVVRSIQSDVLRVLDTWPHNTTRQHHPNHVQPEYTSHTLQLRAQALAVTQTQ